MIASLPMYAYPADQNRALWQALKQWFLRFGMQNVPSEMIVPDDFYAHWLNPTLFLSQTCGYPLSTVLHEQVSVLGTFDYDVPGANSGYYSSMVIVHQASGIQTIHDLLGSVCAFNSQDSQSGYNSLRHLLAESILPKPVFSALIPTGAHIDSIAAVRTRRADVAAIDCVTYALIQLHQPALLEEIRILTQTEAVPGLPLITSRHTPGFNLDLMRSAIQMAISDLENKQLMVDCRIKAFIPMTHRDYEICSEMEQSAIRKNYPFLA